MDFPTYFIIASIAAFIGLLLRGMLRRAVTWLYIIGLSVIFYLAFELTTIKPGIQPWARWSVMFGTVFLSACLAKTLTDKTAHTDKYHINFIDSFLLSFAAFGFIILVICIIFLIYLALGIPM